MAPSPRRHPATPKSAAEAALDSSNTTHDKDDITETWNTATAKLPAFLASLERNDALISSTPGLLLLWTRGYDVDSKGRKVVMSDKHMLQCINDIDTEYTFQDPSPTATYAVANATEARVVALALGIIPPTSTAPDAMAAAQLQATSRQKDLKELFVVNAARLTELDRMAAVYVKRRITNETFATNLATTHHNSGRDMVRALVQMKKTKISDKAKRKLASDFAGRADEGMHNPTVEAFNQLTNDLTKLNEQLKKPKDAEDLIEVYLAAARDSLGEIRQVKLDVKVDAIDRTKMTDEEWMAAVIERITDEITDLEDDADRAQDIARSLLARARRDPAKNRKSEGTTPTPDTRGPRPAWTPEKGKCKYCNKAGAPGTAEAGHWNSECPLLVKNGGTVVTSAPKAPTPPIVGAARMAAQAPPTPDATGVIDATAQQEKLVSAFFAGTKGSNLELNLISSPAELLAALDSTTADTDDAAAAPASRALMARSAVVAGDGEEGSSSPSYSPSHHDSDDDDADVDHDAVNSGDEDDSGDASDDSDAHQPAIQMGLPVTPAHAAVGYHAVPLAALSPTSPKKDIQAHVLNSPHATVRAVSTRTGGSDRRTRADILADVYRATALEAATSADSEGAGARETPVPDDARSVQAARPDADAALSLTTMLRVPPIVTAPDWQTRQDLRSHLADLYRLSWQTANKPCEPPNMSATAKKLHSKRYAFRHRHFDVEYGTGDHGEFGGGTARGFRGKVALYTFASTWSDLATSNKPG